MKYAVLDENNRVSNVVASQPDHADRAGWVLADGVEKGDLWDGNVFIPFRQEALARLASIRWQKSQLMPYDGVTAYADPAIAAVAGKVRVLEESGSTDPVNFKIAATEWRSWTLTEIKPYGQAIDAHIQACFDREATLAAQIANAADFEALRQIDLTAGWPS